jgi:hypothetical protein
VKIYRIATDWDKLIEHWSKQAPSVSYSSEQIFYHGTNSDIIEFDGGFTDKYMGRTDMGGYGAGYYFTTDKLYARAHGKNLISAKLLMDRPCHETLAQIIMFLEKGGGTFNKEVSKQTTVKLINMGFDSVVTEGEVLVFSPQQIKIVNLK